jgi:molybdate transport system substrate-binding protein
MKIGIALTIAIALALSGTGKAAEIKMLASGASKEICSELIPEFEKASGHKVVQTWAGTVDIKKKMAAGEAYDLVIVAAPEVDAFIQQGKMTAGSQVDLLKSGVGIAVRAGAPRPDVSSGEALKKALLAAKSIGHSTGPSGVYLTKLFERLGIADQIKSKVKVTTPGTRVGTLVAKGDAEIGFQQISELMHELGIDYIGPLPADVQNTTVFSSGIPTTATQPDAAKALVQFIKAPAAAPVIKKNGMDPA